MHRPRRWLMIAGVFVLIAVFGAYLNSSQLWVGRTVKKVYEILSKAELYGADRHANAERGSAISCLKDSQRLADEGKFWEAREARSEAVQYANAALEIALRSEASAQKNRAESILAATRRWNDISRKEDVERAREKMLLNYTKEKWEAAIGHARELVFICDQMSKGGRSEAEQDLQSVRSALRNLELEDGEEYAPEFFRKVVEASKKMEAAMTDSTRQYSLAIKLSKPAMRNALKGVTVARWNKCRERISSVQNRITLAESYKAEIYVPRLLNTCRSNLDDLDVLLKQRKFDTLMNDALQLEAQSQVLLSIAQEAKARDEIDRLEARIPVLYELPAGAVSGKTFAELGWLRGEAERQVQIEDYDKAIALVERAQAIADEFDPPLWIRTAEGEFAVRIRHGLDVIEKIRSAEPGSVAIEAIEERRGESDADFETGYGNSP